LLRLDIYHVGLGRVEDVSGGMALPRVRCSGRQVLRRLVLF
jgi:hypothetical protein